MHKFERTDNILRVELNRPEVNDRPLGGHNGPGEQTTQIHNLYWTKRWAGWLGDPIDYDIDV